MKTLKEIIETKDINALFMLLQNNSEERLKDEPEYLDSAHKLALGYIEGFQLLVLNTLLLHLSRNNDEIQTKYNEGMAANNNPVLSLSSSSQSQPSFRTQEESKSEPTASLNTEEKIKKKKTELTQAIKEKNAFELNHLLEDETYKKLIDSEHLKMTMSEECDDEALFERLLKASGDNAQNIITEDVLACVLRKEAYRHNHDPMHSDPVPHCLNLIFEIEGLKDKLQKMITPQLLEGVCMHQETNYLQKKAIVECLLKNSGPEKIQETITPELLEKLVKANDLPGNDELAKYLKEILKKLRDKHTIENESSFTTSSFSQSSPDPTGYSELLKKIQNRDSCSNDELLRILVESVERARNKHTIENERPVTTPLLSLFSQSSPDPTSDNKEDPTQNPRYDLSHQRGQ